MTTPVKLNLKIYQGSTFRETLRWESSTKVYVPIVTITKSAPMTVTANSHNLPVGWRAKVVGAGGMKEINSIDSFIATETTANTITVNSVNSLNFTAFTTGGVLEYNQPVDLAGYSGRMQIRSKVDSDTVLHELTEANSGVVINNTLKTIVLSIPANITSSFSWTSGVYSLELVKGSEVIPFCNGIVSVVKEVTR